MMAKALPLLLVLMLCGCLLPADALSGCRCVGTVRRAVPFRVIKQIEMFRISGHCRRSETILTRRNGSKICIDPNQQWFKDLLKEFGAASRSNVTQNSTGPDKF